MSHIIIDGVEIPFTEGQTIMQAAAEAGVYIPHLCHHPEFKPHGSCKLCTVTVNGRHLSACTFPAGDGQVIENNSDELNADRKRLTQMLFVEGNHFCPTCEKSGNCQLQAVAYHLNMLDNHYPHFFQERKVDGSHDDLLIDHNRCIFCALCVRASDVADGKQVFAIAGRGRNKHLVVNSESGNLGDSTMSKTDRAAHICPTGAILERGTAFKVPIGQRIYDHHDIAEVSLGEGHEH